MMELPLYMVMSWQIKFLTFFVYFSLIHFGLYNMETGTGFFYNLKDFNSANSIAKVQKKLRLSWALSIHGGTAGDNRITPAMNFAHCVSST